MVGTGKKTQLPNNTVKKPSDKQASKPPTAPIEDEDIEDGDIATPKHDRYGEDDQPL